MADDPWADVQPIGARHTPSLPEPPPAKAQSARPLIGISNDERWRRAERTRANAEDKTGARSALRSRKNRGWSGRPLQVRELIAQGAALARKCYALGLSDESKPHEAKQHIVAWGVTVDKLNALEGRPTQIVAVSEMRAGVTELGARIAGSLSNVDTSWSA